ncbi:MAG TPA: pseudouridine synthase, partial [Mycobacterium sp.]|nr:pseudouridine synthase [Mycobacterium sp.]
MRSAPLPVRDGLGPARVRLLGGVVVDEFRARWGDDAAAKVLAGEVVLPDGTMVSESTVL